MKSAETWLKEYSQSHQNPTNQKIHTIVVYLIFWSTLAILWAIPIPEFLQSYLVVNWGTLILFLANVFYFRLGLRYSLPMLSISIACVYVCYWIQISGSSLLYAGLSIFIPAWIAQFYGHKVEGKKPSFFTDILYLFVGPLWVLEKLKVKSPEA